MVWKCDSAGTSEDRPGNGPEKRPRRNESDEIPESGFKERKSADGSRLSFTSTKRRFRKSETCTLADAADSVDWNLALGRTDTTWPHAARNNVLELHRAELWNDAQRQLRIYELSGEASTLSLPQRAGTPHEQLGSTFRRDLSITIQPRTKRMTAHLRRGKLCWS